MTRGEAARGLLSRLSAELGLDTEVTPDLDCTSLESIAAGLRAPGRALRLVTLDARSLAHLEPPVLTVFEGELSVLRRIRRRSVALERAEGSEQTLPPAALLAGTTGTALELRETLRGPGGFARRLARLLAGRASELWLLVLLSFGLAGVGLLLPLATELTVDRALPERAPKLLSLIALGTLLVSVQRAAFMSLRQRAARALAGRVEAAVSMHLFDHLLRIPYPALMRENMGSWLETLQSAHRLQTLLMDALLPPLLEVAMIFVYGAVLVARDATLSVLLLGLTLLPLVLSAVLAVRTSRLERAQIAAGARQSDALFESMSGVVTLRTAGAQQWAVLRWLARALEARSTSAAGDQLAALGRAWVVGTFEAIGLFVFAWSGFACLRGDLSVGELLSTILIADRCIDIVASAAASFTPLLVARSHLARVDALLAIEDGAPKGAAPRVFAAPDLPAVVLDDVWFRHAPDQPWVLRGYSLRIATLERFVLSGPSGSGKTTILRLIAGLYTPERGTVQVFGHRPDKVRREIAYLPQDAHLFQGSIQENLSLLSDGAGKDALRAAAERSGLAEFVASLPMGYETVLPPGATTLSGGQRQLIAWTATMACGRRLLLMDEALSQVDRITRARLLAMSRDRPRTVISVEHERG